MINLIIITITIIVVLARALIVALARPLIYPFFLHPHLPFWSFFSSIFLSLSGRYHNPLPGRPERST